MMNAMHSFQPVIHGARFAVRAALFACLMAAGLLLALTALLRPDFLAAAPAQPDLVAEIAVSPSNPGVGEEVTVSFVVRNLGDAGTGASFTAYLYVDPPDQPPKLTTPGRPFGFPPLGGGQTSAEASRTYTFADAGCHHRIYVWVDRDSQVSEANEDNNLVEYQLCVGVACDVDSYEGDQSPWDNARSHSTWIAPGTGQSHTFCHPQNKQLPDEDWVKFTTYTGLTYTLQAVAQGAHANPQVIICGADCSQPLAGPDNMAVWQASGSGLYYARIVNGEAGQPNPGPLTAYSLTLSAATGLTDAYEPDDRCTAARDIPTNGSWQSHLFQKPEDQDWIRFTVKAGQSFSLHTDNLGAGSKPVLCLYDSCTKARDRSVALESVTGQLQLSAPADQAYVVQITNQNPNRYGADASYDVQVLASDCSGDQHEEDDLFTQAANAGVGDPPRTYNTCPAGDQDWVRFAVQKDAIYVLETATAGEAADTVLTLYDQDGVTPLAANDDFGYSNGSRLVWQPAQSGVYYAMIRHHNPEVSGPTTEYRFHIREGVCAPDEGDGAGNGDNGPGDALALSTDGALQTHNFCADPLSLDLGDQDWVRIQTQAGGVYTLRASGAGVNADPVLEVYAPDGTTLVARNDDAGSGVGATLAFTATSSGTYFARAIQFNSHLFGDETQYQLAAFETPPPTPTPTPTPPPAPTPTPFPTPPPSEMETIILVNRQRLSELYGAARTEALLNKVLALADHEQVKGAVLALDDNPAVATAYAAWLADPTNVDKANQVTAAIRGVVLSALESGPNVHNVVIVGDDRVIPFRRVTEGAMSKQEAAYADQVTDPWMSAMLAADQILTDDYYVDREPDAWQGHELYLPDYGIGRLVETPEEIMGLIDQFLGEPNITAQRTLVTGYDFIQDSADVIGTMFDADGLAVERLIASSSSTWGGDQLRGVQLNAPQRLELQSINGHSTHVSTGAPDEKNILASEVASASGDLAGSVVFAVGCHGGFNDPGVLDLPQAYARQKVYYVGNTGYGWGGGGIIYSERLMRNFARDILRDASAQLGPALVRAKQRYRNQAFAFGPYDAKILMQTTLYGLPMLTVNSGGALGDDDPFPSAEETFSPPGFGTHEGSFEFNLSGTFGDNDAPGEGSYPDLDGEIAFAAGAPIMPRYYANVSALAAGTLRGALFLGGLYTDITDYDPVVARPHNEYVTDLSEPAFQSEGWYPAIPFVLQNSLTISDTADMLVMSPGQFSGGGDGGSVRLYNQMTLSALYSDSSDVTPPEVLHVDGILDPAAKTGLVKVDARDLSGVRRVVVAFTGGDGAWRSQDLPYDPPRLKATGVITDVVAGVRYFVQVADSAGNVAVADNKGRYYTLLPPLPLASGQGVGERLYLPIVQK